MKASAVVIPIAPAIELKKILYATDFSDASLAALPLVSTIAHKYGSRVFVVNVWTPVPYAMVSPEAAAVLQHEDELESSSQGARPHEHGGIWLGYRRRLLFDQVSQPKSWCALCASRRLILPFWAPMAAPE